MPKTYYTYKLFDKNDNFYIGSSSCYGDPEGHAYYGSGSAIKNGEFVPIRKEVLSLFMTREEAGKAEKALIKQADYRNNPRCFNRVCAGANQTDEALAKRSKTTTTPQAQLNFCLPAELYTTFQNTCSREGTSMSHTLRQLIKEYCKHYGN